MPIPESIQDHYGAPEDYWAESYFNWNPDYFAFEINEVKELIPFQKGMKALDIGAGIGKAMKSLELNGFEFYGFEPSKRSHQCAIEKMNISPESIKLGAIEEVDYEKNSFDFITFGAVFDGLGAGRAIETLFIEKWQLSPWGVLIMMQLSYILMGMFRGPFLQS